MSRAVANARREYLRFAAASALVVVTLALLGWIPTRLWAGDAGGPAVFVGCAISLTAALLSGGYLARTASRPDEGTPLAALMAMGFRLGTTAVLGALAVFSGLVPVKPLLIWIGVTYLALLALETRFAVGLMGDDDGTDPERAVDGRFESSGTAAAAGETDGEGTEGP